MTSAEGPMLGGGPTPRPLRVKGQRGVNEPLSKLALDDIKNIEIDIEDNSISGDGRKFVGLRFWPSDEASQQESRANDPRAATSEPNPEGTMELNTCPNGAKEIRPIFKSDVESAYASHAEEVREETKRAPTIEADLEWAQSNDIGRETVRDLRRKTRSPKEKKGGRPKDA